MIVDMDGIYISFAPNLGVDPETFRAWWDEDGQTRSVADVALEKERGFFDGNVAETLVVLGNIATGVASSAVYDLIIHILKSHNLRAHIRRRPSADGAEEIELVPDM